MDLNYNLNDAQLLVSKSWSEQTNEHDDQVLETGITMGTTVEFENDRVRVLRVKHAGRERHPETSRQDRLIIYLNEGHVIRSEDGKQEEIRHKSGEVVWKDRSQHQIENLKDTGHEVIIIEFK